MWMLEERLAGLRRVIDGIDPLRAVGRVKSVEGAILWLSGLAGSAGIGDRVQLTGKSGQSVEGEVLRLAEDDVAMMASGPVDGIGRGDRVDLLGPATLAPDNRWIGRVIDPYGRPLDGRALLPGPRNRGFRTDPPPARARRGFGPRLASGLNVFDTVLPFARGQRLGLFAGSGVGKSTLTAQLTTAMEADVVVLALVGERGRELRDFVEEKLGSRGMRRTVVVAATSDRSPLERRRCPMAAMTVAEHFRDQGMHVFYVVDSITRFAEAHREAAIAAGEMPALRGFPASTAHQIMALSERAGPGGAGAGDITGLFSVLVAGSDMDEPIADILRGVLDGHVVLDRGLAERGRFPAIDVLRSVSRSLPDIAASHENACLATLRQLLNAHARNDTMIRAGLYKAGSDALVDQAIAALPEIESFLTGPSPQGPEEAFAQLSMILRRAGASVRPAQEAPGRKAGRG